MMGKIKKQILWDNKFYPQFEETPTMFENLYLR